MTSALSATRPAAAEPPSSSPERSARKPRPLRSAAIPVALIPVPGVLWAAAVVPPAAAAGLAALLVALALVQGGLGLIELRRSRRLGDALLRAHPGRAPISGLAAWRAAELTSTRNRHGLTHCVRRLRHETESCLLLESPRVERGVLETSLVLLRRLERRLELLSAPVAPLGMLEAEALAAGGFGPLSCPERARGLPSAVVRALAALEPA